MREQCAAIIYDMDGVLMDSEPFWRKVEMETFATVGLHLTEEDCRRTTGFRFDEVVHYWWQRQPWEGKSQEQIYDEVINRMEQAIADRAVAMTGVSASLRFFKERGVKIALASSSPMRLIRAAVRKLQIEPYFDLLVSAENEIYGKPHPAIFIRTAEMLQVLPKCCLVIEDSYHGLIAAKAAKMRCVVVPDKTMFNSPHWVIADYKLQSLNEIPSVWSGV